MDRLRMGLSFVLLFLGLSRYKTKPIGCNFYTILLNA